jgi:protein TonB
MTINHIRCTFLVAGMLILGTHLSAQKTRSVTAPPSDDYESTNKGNDGSFGPPPDSIEAKPPIYVYVEVMPEFIGGKTQLDKFLYDQLVYPPEAIKDEIEGTINMIFIVDREGNTIRHKIVKNIHPLLDAEALRIAQTMPKWKPGTIKGEPVDVYVIVPIEFKLK